MDRLSISANVPADIAERISDVGGEEYSAEDLKDAREELIEKLLAGDKVGHVDLEGLIDYEADTNRAAFVRNLYEHFAGIGSDSRTGDYDRCMKAGEWMQRLVEAHLDAHPEVVEERAAEIAAMKLEDASV